MIRTNPNDEAPVASASNASGGTASDGVSPSGMRTTTTMPPALEADDHASPVGKLQCHFEEILEARWFCMESWAGFCQSQNLKSRAQALSCWADLQEAHKIPRRERGLLNGRNVFEMMVPICDSVRRIHRYSNTTDTRQSQH